MRTTITIRAEESLRRSLAERAAARGQSLSALVREILEDALAERPLESRAGHLKGGLQLSRGDRESFVDRLRRRNWRS